MDELKNMGWSSEANTFVSYSKRSGDNEICVSKPSVFGEKIERVSEDRIISSKEAKSSFTTFNPRSVYTQNTLLEITIEPSGMFPFFNRRVDTLSQKYYENQ